MPTLADEDAAVVEHHPGEEEAKVPEQVLDFAVAAGVRSVDDLDNVSNLDRVLLRVEAERLRVLLLLLQGRRLGAHNLAVHVQDLERSR